jgi:hypothetical protein
MLHTYFQYFSVQNMTELRLMPFRAPFGLRLLLPFWCWRGGIGARLVQGWRAEKENRGKGGSGQGKIGAKVVREWVLPDP